MAYLSYMVPVGEGDPEWSNQEKTSININVQVPHLGGKIVRTTCSKSDHNYEHSEELFLRAIAGDFGPIREYSPKRQIVPTSVTDRQFFQALYKLGFITYEEARSAIKTGDIPQIFQAYIDSLQKEEAEDVTFLFEGETSFYRDNKVLIKMSEGLGQTKDQVDDIFIFAGSL